MLGKKTPTSSRTPQTMRSPRSVSPESSRRSSSGSISFLETDSCYFPGCKKDANCKCEICIASMNATLDLMPQSTQRSSLTMVYATQESKIPSKKVTSFSQLTPTKPIYFNQLSPLTPTSSGNSTCSDESLMGSQENRGLFRRVLMVLGIFLVLEFGFSWMVSEVFQPKLSDDVVRSWGEKAWGLNDFDQRLDFFKNELKRVVNANMTDCASHGSNWVLNQDGLLLNSKCVLYKSISEEVSVWGWPLQTAGLLTTEFSSRSFTILSGRLTEWTNGGISYKIRTANSSWRQQQWASSAIQLDAKTWILEYKQSCIIENARLVSAALKFINFRVTREFAQMKKQFWQSVSFEQEFWQAVYFRNNRTDLRTPT